jgi:hypothetical protein
MAKTVAQKVTDALNDQFDQECVRAIKGRFGIKVVVNFNHMGVISPERLDGQPVSRDVTRFAEAMQLGYLAAAQVAQEAAYTGR